MDDAVLHEPSCRRSRWSETAGEWITLGDGQAWLFPKPIISLRPKFSGGRMIGRKVHADLGAEFNEVRNATKEAIDADDSEGFEEGVVGLAVLMIQVNYDLDEDAVGELLDSKKLTEDFLIEVWRVASGQGPKPLPAGGD